MDNKKQNITINLNDTEKPNRNVHSSIISAVINPLEHTTVRSRYGRIIQNFLLVWLDISNEESNSTDYQSTILELQQVVSAVNKFIDVDECSDFVTDIKEEKVFMVLSGESSQTIVPIIQDILQINSIYIFCENKSNHEQWITQWSKIKGVFTEISSLCKLIKKGAHQCDHNSISMSFIPASDEAPSQNLDQLDQSFMYTQLLKEILFTIDFKGQHKEFINYYREQFPDNVVEMGKIEKLDKEYNHHEPIWWYTYQIFLYSMVNRALRTMEIDLIIKLGFFICDLHDHIAELHSKQ